MEITDRIYVHDNIQRQVDTIPNNPRPVQHKPHRRYQSHEKLCTSRWDSSSTLHWSLYLISWQWTGPWMQDQTGSWWAVTGFAGTIAGAILKCMPRRCPACNTKATCLAARAAASCFSEKDENYVVRFPKNYRWGDHVKMTSPRII